MNAFSYGKMSQSAIAALSFLAENYDGGGTQYNSAQIAEARNLSQPLVAKILTSLSQAGFVSGAPGPKGGYTMGRDPAEISFFDVVMLFERVGGNDLCPFGPGWCGNEEPCPVHDQIFGLQESMENFLKKTRFSVFREAEA